MSRSNLEGKKFHSLTVIEYIKANDWRDSAWLCKCDCGKLKKIKTNGLTSGRIKSCGCKQHASENHRDDLTGRRFGRWTVLEYSHSNYARQTFYKCRCDCGNEKIVGRGALVKNESTSCGCYHMEAITKHNKSNTPLWRVWKGIKERCEKEYSNNFSKYGAKGITVCDEWKNDFSTFYDWAMSNGYKDGLTIERKDNLNGYSPDNCKWADYLEQNNNRSCCHMITFEGETHTIAEWARIKGISKSTIGNRLLAGWSEADALTIPTTNRFHYLTYNGETKTYTEWSRHLGISESTLRNRLNRGMTAEEAIETPINKNLSRSKSE